MARTIDRFGDRGAATKDTILTVVAVTSAASLWKRIEKQLQKAKEAV